MKRLLSALVGVTLMTYGVTLIVHDNTPRAVVEADRTVPAVVPTVEPTVPPAASSKPSAGPFVPATLAIPYLHVTVPVLSIETEGSVLTPPPDPQTVGWWRSGSKPGGREGAALLTGHTVHTGGGALDDLETLPVNTIVTIKGAHQSLPYRVVSVRVMSKTAVAREAAELFSTEGEPRLVLVTCEDYDVATGEYASNVVVVGEPIQP